MNYRVSILAFCIFFGVIGFWVSGYSVGVHDQNLYIPVINKLLNPALYPTDVLLDFAADNTTIVWLIGIPLFEIFGIELSMLILQVFSFVIFLVGVFLVTRTISKSNIAACLAVAFLALPKIGLMGLLTYHNYFAPRFLALAVVLIGIHFILSKRSFIGIGILALACYINVLVALPIAAAIFFARLFILRGGRFRDFLKEFFLFAILLAPLVIGRIIFSEGGSGLYVDRDWFEFARNALGIFYNLPFTSQDEALNRNNLIGVVQIILIFVILSRSIKDEAVKKFLNLFTLGTSLVFISFFVFVEFLPITIIMQLQLSRIALIVQIIFYILFAVYIFRELYLKRKFSLFAVGFLAGILAQAHIFIIFYQVLKLAESRFKFIEQSWMLNFLAALGFFIFLIPSFSKLNFKEVKIFYSQTPELDVQRWMKENTPIETMFITPSYIDERNIASFRVYSERGVVALNSELAQVSISKGLEVSLRERMDDLTKSLFSEALPTGRYSKIYTAMLNGYNSLEEEDFVYLKEKYKAPYAIVERRLVLDFEKVYENSKFFIYKIN